MPVAVAGQVKTFNQAKELFWNGADKVVLNTALFENQSLIMELVRYYGSQNIVASLDFKRESGNELTLRKSCGSEATGYNIAEGVRLVSRLGVDEIMLNSIDRNGTGMGYDLPALEIASLTCDIPLVSAGGADTPDKLVEGIKADFVTVVSTSHLFTFMGDGLQITRALIRDHDICLANWDFVDLG